MCDIQRTVLIKGFGAIAERYCTLELTGKLSREWSVKLMSMRCVDDLKRTEEEQMQLEFTARHFVSQGTRIPINELLPLLDILANKVKAIRCLRELLTTKLPHGTFPVKVHNYKLVDTSAVRLYQSVLWTWVLLRWTLSGFSTRGFEAEGFIK